MIEYSLTASTGILRLREDDHGDATVCTFGDPRVEARNAFALKRHLQLRLQRPGRFVLDLSSVEFIDSTGLGALIGGLKMATHPENFILVRPPDAAFGVFRTTKTEGLFNWADSVPAAVGSTGSADKA